MISGECMRNSEIIEEIKKMFNATYPQYMDMFKVEVSPDKFCFMLDDEILVYDLEINKTINFQEDMGAEFNLWQDVMSFITNLVDNFKIKIIGNTIDDIIEDMEANSNIHEKIENNELEEVFQYFYIIETMMKNIRKIVKKNRKEPFLPYDKYITPYFEMHILNSIEMLMFDYDLDIGQIIEEYDFTIREYRNSVFSSLDFNS